LGAIAITFTDEPIASGMADSPGCCIRSFARIRGPSVSPFRKLFIAGAIVGAGLGVAVLLGEPASFKQALDAVDQGLKSVRGDEPCAKPAPSSAWAASGAQLVPETNTYPSTAQVVVGSAPPLLERHSAPIKLGATPPASIAGPQFAASLGAPNPPASQYELPARARLRSEAPRPIGNEPRSPATIRRAPPAEIGAANAPSVDHVNQLSSGWAPPPTLPVGFTTAENAALAAPAAYDAPNGAANQRLVSPPPWPASIIGEGARMHVVVDGDSLERLANRYLDDPRRSREIYELNRELLSNPDLLPIGVELKIPDRGAQTFDANR
jgi:nucleoid-associated protein YgaU